MTKNDKKRVIGEGDRYKRAPKPPLSPDDQAQVDQAFADVTSRVDSYLESLGPDALRIALARQIDDSDLSPAQKISLINRLRRFFSH